MDQAVDAIYVDFECLMGQPPEPPQPKLLGVLIGADDEQLDQLILDEALAPAAVANRRTRVVNVGDAVGAIIHAAQTNDQRIIGWSFFDGDRMIDARPDLAPEIRAHYVNALQIARPWRKELYPSFTIEPEDDFAPKHTLDKYARLAEYPHVKAFTGAQPAQWIRHVLRQLAANGGRYRRTTKETKRRLPALSERSESKWNKLLEYNRHDLLALHHIVLRAGHELASWRAYKRTRFCVDEGKRRTCFMAGGQNRRLDRLLERHHAVTWAFITAWNPRSMVLDRRENDAQQQALKKRLARYRTLRGEGLGEDPSWPPEDSLLVLDISERAAVSIGREFDQLAIVVGRRGSRSRLVSCVDRRS